MDENKNIELSKLIKKGRRLSGRITLAFNTGQIDRAEKLMNQMEELINQFQGDLPRETEIHYSITLRFKSNLLAYRGDFSQSYNTANKILTFAEKSSNNKAMFEAYSSFGRLYLLSGDLDKALANFDLAIEVSREQYNEHEHPLHLTVAITMATRAAVENNDIEEAEKYFKGLEDLYNRKKEQGGIISSLYKYAKAYLLKHSKRARDRVYAEELCKEIFEDKMSPDWILFSTHVYLCELLLTELRLSNDVSVIDELNLVIERFMEMAQQRGFNYYLVEGYVLQAKLALLTFDMKTARRLLTQARRIAERLGFSGVADEVSNLEQGINVKMDLWEQLEKENAPLSERIELAGLNEHLRGKFRTRIMKMERVAEQELTVYKSSQICLVCKGHAEGFNIFICPGCKSIYCKTCIEALIDLENECWSCDTPIDESKLVKLPEIKEDQEEVFIEEPHKKGK